MPHHLTRRVSFISLCLLLVFAFAISGCGKKGPLYLPPTGQTTSHK